MKKVYTRITAIAFMLMLITAISYGQKTIGYIATDADYASSTHQSDIDLFDSISSWTEFEAVWIPSSDVANIVFDDYYGLFITEWLGSSSVDALGNDFDNTYLLPMVSLEGYSIRSGHWNWVTDNDNMFVHTETGTEESNTMIITDNSHYITKVYNEDDEVDWTDPGSIGIDQALVRPTSFAEDQVTWAAALGQSKALVNDYPDLYMLIAVDNDVLPNKVAFWGILGEGLDAGLGACAATPDYYKIIKRMCQWAFDEEEIDYSPVESVKSESMEITVFPNPTTGRTIVRFMSSEQGNAVASLYNVAGQHVATFERNAIAGRNFIVLEASDYAPGMYHMGIELNGNTEFQKLIIK